MDIMRWSGNPQDACIFWLSGMAGTGKSTISRTVARRWYDENRLGASFFFSRGQGDLAHASKFFATLACQLAHSQPSLATPIREAILKNPNITKQGLQDQWAQLIQRPLSQIKGFSSELVLVIDALDECDGEKDIRLILHLLAQANSLGSVRLKIFVTSRPETPIQLGFRDISNDSHRDFTLHAILDAVVNHDISVLLQHEFEGIRKRHELPDEWPDSSNLDRLVQKAGGLFIYATTVCRFIGYEYSHPPNRLILVLNDTKEHGSSMEQLDSMYTTLLRHAVTSKDGKPQEEELLAQRFRRIVGSIVVLRDTLTAAALTELIHAEGWEVKQTLRSLGSVLRYSGGDGSPITLLHPSFRDFLLDNTRCQDPRLMVVAESTHKGLAVRCLELMSRGLRRGICSQKHSGILKSDIDPETLRRFLPAEVQYACRYWVDHLQRGNVKLCDGEPLHNQVDDFFNEHFLHWLEALSLLGNMHDGILMVKAINSMLPVSKLKNSKCTRFWRAAVKRKSEDTSVCDTQRLGQLKPVKGTLRAHRLPVQRRRHPPSSTGRGFDVICTDVEVKSDANPRLLAMARDAARFSQTFRAVIETAPHQVYCSALIFSPRRSTVKEQFRHNVPHWIKETPMVPEDWDSTLQVLNAHTRDVNSVRFSPDGKLLASGSDDNTVRLWDPATGTCHSTLKGHSGWVHSVAFSPDGKLLASGSKDNTVKLWDPATGTCLSTLKGHSDRVRSVAFSPDGKLLASGADDKTVRLWDPATGTCRSTLEGHSGWVFSVVFSPDGKLLTSGSKDNTVKLWDPATGTCHNTLEGHSGAIFSVAFSPDGKLLASGSKDNTVKLWVPAMGTCHGTLKGHSDWVRSVAFAPDGKLLASGADDKTVRLWDPATATCRSTLEGHSGVVTSVTFSPDGELLASGAADKTVRLWGPAAGTCRSTLEGHSDWVTSVVFSPDGKLLASGSKDNTVRLWEPAAGTCCSTLKGHSGAIFSVAFSPDGKLLASGSKDNTVRLWDPVTGTCRSTLEGYSGWVFSVAFSPDGKILASGSGDKIVRLWDPATGTCRSTLEGHSDSVRSVAFSPDGKLLASVSDDNTLRLWDPATGTCSSTLTGHSNWVFSVAFSPDGKLLASGSRDNTVRLWDSATGTCRSTLTGHSGAVMSVVFSADGKLLRSHAYDDAVLFWDVDQAKDFQQVQASDAPCLSLPTGPALDPNLGLAEPASDTRVASQLPTTLAFLFHVSKGWIFFGERKLLLLSRNRGSPVCFACSGSLVAIGYDSGMVCYVGFNADSIP